MQRKMKKLLSGALLTTTALSVIGCSSGTEETVKTPTSENSVVNTPVEENPSPEAKNFSQIIAFGDSGSDNGGSFAVSSAIVEAGNTPEAYIKPGELYWENRYSNGKTAIEVAAELSGLNLVNNAIGGATSGYANYSDWMDTLGSTGVLGQIDRFEESLNGEKADSDALYFVFAGGNDYFKFLDYGLEGTLEELSNEVVTNIETAITKLTGLGAEHFLVPTNLDVSKAPFEIQMGRVELAKEFLDGLEAQLPTLLEDLEAKLGVSITQFDIGNTVTDMIENPDKYGIKEVAIPAQATYPDIKPLVENPDEYIFFDEWHFSKVTHKVIGEAMHEVIKGIEVK